MDINLHLKTLIHDALKGIGVSYALDDITIERSRDEKHGDYASNIAMQLAKTLHRAPRDIANDIINNIDKSTLEKIEIAGPGFLNMTMNPLYLTRIIDEINELGENYGQLTQEKPLNINVEFVSANPTGELHLGHARGAALGDSLSRILEKAGHKVTREYYVNDAGVQIDNLAKSIFARYRTLLGDNTPVPVDGYHSEQLIDVAKSIINEVGDKYKTLDDEALHFFRNRGVEIELEQIKADLAMFNVQFDVYSFETKIRSNNAVEKLLENYKPFTYVEDGATFLKTSEYGDDKDRVIVKSNGEYTYFLPDIVYHLDKLSRGYDLLIDVLGADHHGYINRMKAALNMSNYPRDILHVELIQMVRLVEDGKEVKMSKRTGNAITLRELCNDVGVDAVRYFFVARASSSHLDFDINLAKQASNANPLYYVQYAYARLKAVMRNGENIKGKVDYRLLSDKYELDLMKHLIDFPLMISDAAYTKAPYKVAIYLQKLATLVHSFYTECRILQVDSVPLTATRLALVNASATTLKIGLNLIGVSAPENM
jgi:arginyl-tRNA synthetase